MRNSKLCGIALWLVFAGANARAAGTVRALADELKGPALDAYMQARRLFEHGDYVTAHAKFREAYDRSRNARVLWNLAATSARQRRYALALDEMRQHLAEGKGQLAPDVVERANEFIGEMSGYVATTTFQLAPAGVALAIDGDLRPEQGPTRTVNLDWGKHEIAATAEGCEPLQTTINVNDVKARTFSFALRPLHAAVPAAAPAAATATAHLAITTDAEAVVEVDGKAVATGSYYANIPPGVHHLRISAAGKKSYSSDLDLTAGVTRQLGITLRPEAQAMPDAAAGGAWWPWAVGGAVLAAGAGIGSYYLFKPADTQAPVTPGTVATITLNP